MTMTYFIGWFVFGLLAGAIYLGYASRFGREQEKRLYVFGLILAALIYVVFALIWGNLQWVIIEFLGVLIYGVVAYLGWRWSFYWVAFGWLLHPIWDFGLHLYGAGIEVAPTWYVIACISFDILVAGTIGYKVYHWQKQETSLSVSNK